MRRTLTSLLIALMVAAGALSTPLAAHPTDPVVNGGSDKEVPPSNSKPAAETGTDIPAPLFEGQARQQLLELANKSRAEAGVSPLSLDAGLSQAARTHALAMIEARQLSHRFEGELSVPERLAAMTHLQLDRAGENVAWDYSAEDGHQHLMLSLPHRENLLNPVYNVVGLAVVRSGSRIYIVEDFGHAVPSYSADEVKDRIATTVNQLRHRVNQPELRRGTLLAGDEAACSMAQADKLGTAPVHQLAERYTVLTFTSLHSDTLPIAATPAVTSPDLTTLRVGTCYARTDTYPTGIYWVVLSLD